MSPPPLEDTIASLANFVSSGSIQRIQNTVIRLNRLTPRSGEVRRLTSRVVNDLTDLSDNIDRVDQLLNGVSGTAQVLNARIPQLRDYLSPRGQLAIARSVHFYRYLASSFYPGSAVSPSADIGLFLYLIRWAIPSPHFFSVPKSPSKRRYRSTENYSLISSYQKTSIPRSTSPR